MDLRDLTAEQQAKIQRAKDPQELLALSMEEGIELTDDDLEKVSGGWDDSDSSGQTCPVCGSVNVAIESFGSSGSFTGENYVCNNCSNVWTAM